MTVVGMHGEIAVTSCAGVSLIIDLAPGPSVPSFGQDPEVGERAPIHVRGQTLKAFPSVFADDALSLPFGAQQQTLELVLPLLGLLTKSAIPETLSFEM